MDRGVQRCWGLSCLSVAWLITEANTKRIAGGNKDTSMSAVCFSEGPIRQVDAYWQAGDRKREMWRDEGEDRALVSVLKSLTLAQAAMSADPVAITLWALSGVLFKAKQISGTECHHKDTKTSSPPISVRGFKSPFLLPPPANPSSSFLYPGSTPPFDPPSSTPRGGTEQQIYDLPIWGQAGFIDITCQLSFWEIARRINFKYVLMLNILETLNFMVGDALSLMSIYHDLVLHRRNHYYYFFFKNLI